MRTMLHVLAGAAVAIGVTFVTLDHVQAAPMSTAPALGNTSPAATPVHCRRYYHCHRRCWTGRYGRYHCRRFCHRCGY